MSETMVGLIGGMSWESSAQYYRLINEQVREARWGVHSARLLLWSFDFAQIEALQAAGDWDGAGTLLVDAAQQLELAGASAVVICTNTMHRLADTVQAAIGVPLLHIADPTATRVLVHRVIYEELVRGHVLPASREAYRGVMRRLVERGAQGIILGCTEIMLLVADDDAGVPLFDTTALHAQAAAQHLLAQR